MSPAKLGRRGSTVKSIHKFTDDLDVVLESSSRCAY